MKRTYNIVTYNPTTFVLMCVISGLFFLYNFIELEKSISVSEKYADLKMYIGVVFISILVLLISYKTSSVKIKIEILESDLKFIWTKNLIFGYRYIDEKAFNLNAISSYKYECLSNSWLKHLSIKLISGDKINIRSDYWFGSKQLDQFVEYLKEPETILDHPIPESESIYSKRWYQWTIFILAIVGTIVLIYILINHPENDKIGILTTVVYLSLIYFQLFEIFIKRKENTNANTR